MAADKKTIRNEVRQNLRDWGKGARVAASLEISEKLIKQTSDRGALLGFFPTGLTEPMIGEVLFNWPRLDMRVCLPRVVGTEIHAHLFTGLDGLRQSDLGIHEPDPKACEQLPLDALNYVLVPGVAFTQDGDRLGRGGGYYDRFLARLSPQTKTIGIAYSRQILASLPVESHDRRVDMVITNDSL